MDVYYDLSDADGDLQLIQVAASSDAGLTYSIPCTTLSGHVGAGISPGTNRKITWNAGVDWNGNWVPQCRVRVTAHDGTTPLAPSGMAYIPAGPFQMGDNLDGNTVSMPVHNVYVTAFFMDKYEVSKEIWQSVQAWGNNNGYSIAGGSWKDAGHPVQTINWYEAVKWCNARSQMEGLTPCYYNDSAQTIVYRNSNANIDNTMVKWSSGGYRLPTEAEWEKAARGGATGQRFPWGNDITHNLANYKSDAAYAYDTSSTRGFHPIYGSGSAPVGAFQPNNFGIYNMSGNVLEMIWDWHDPSYYGTSASLIDPQGPISGIYRALRGGASVYTANDSGVAKRNWQQPTGSAYYQGFRCVRK